MIQIKKHAELSSEVKTQLDDIIYRQFGHIPIVQEIKWATPDWTLIWYAGNEIATFYNIVERTIIADNAERKIAGINNVITVEKYRGQGLSSMLLKKTADFLFNELQCEAGLLLCADELVPFYSRLNWYQIDCPVYFDQPVGKKKWTANTMLFTNKNKWIPESIDLNGYPW